MGMSREEAIEVLQQDIPCEHDTDLIEALDMAIEALEQEPCTDTISRQAVIEAFWKLNVELRPSAIDAITNMIKDLPPVKPQYTDTEIQKMQDLEFAEIQTAYEIGKAENPNKWIPVSERLPKVYERVLVTRRMFHWTNEPVEYAVGIESFSGNIDFVAWMPLPEPYKASPTGAESEG